MGRTSLSRWRFALALQSRLSPASASANSYQPRGLRTASRLRIVIVVSSSKRNPSRTLSVWSRKAAASSWFSHARVSAGVQGPYRWRCLSLSSAACSSVAVSACCLQFWKLLVSKLWRHKYRNRCLSWRDCVRSDCLFVLSHLAFIIYKNLLTNRH